MTLLFVDGFDVGDFELLWLNGGTTAPTLSTVVPFAAGRSVKIGAANYSQILKKGITPSAEVIVGVNFRWDSEATFSGADEVGVFALYSDSGAIEHLRLGVSAAGVLTLRRGGTLLASGPPTQILPGIFYFIEIKATIDNAAGTCIVHVNQIDEPINFVGDTRNGGTSTNVDVVALHVLDFADTCPDCYFDDAYICNGLDDTVGPANDDFLGIGRAQTLLPSAAGASTDLTPVGSGSNWDNVNDVPYSTADYNFSTTPGDRDTYQLSDLASSTATIAGVQTVVIARSDDTSAQVKAALRSGGTVYYDPTVALNGSPAAASAVVRETDPATAAAWTPAGVNALEAGVEIVS